MQPEIQQSTDVTQWRHVKGDENPSDLISRGCSPTKLISSDVVAWAFMADKRLS